MLRDLIQEVRELGVRGTAFRVGWELWQRTGVAARWASAPPVVPTDISRGPWTSRLPFAEPVAVADVMADRIAPSARAALSKLAADATRGRIRCFGRWRADYGDPIDWQKNPLNGQRWNADTPWTHALTDEPRVGDVKLTWEVARFPHAYWMARAAAFAPDTAPLLATALVDQMEQFLRANPYGRGVHWVSGQEVALRLLAWLFALDTMLVRGEHGERATVLIADSLAAGAAHVEDTIPYARFAVYNNHLLTESLLLYAVGVLLPELEPAPHWREMGRRILVAEADRQFHDDGAYIQLSHNYHRVALQSLLWAGLIARVAGDQPAPSWLAAIDRSLRFLVAHQNPSDGRLPNYGANDGALPMVLSTCDFSDFRPALQAASVAVHGERLYDAGPWDEATAWLHGPAALDLPLRPPVRRSISFGATGFHVLRGTDESSFATFRCGTIRDRFSQIDMLHLDVWWRGHNVLVDPGSYLYNAEAVWHEHFLQTASHNTITIDGRDQMLHFRRFKNLYWTGANLLGFADTDHHAMCAGEHHGYARHAGGCVHRRSVLFDKRDLWVVVDEVRGDGAHDVALHWLGGEHAWQYDDARLTLDTPSGPLSIAVYDAAAAPVAGTVVAGASAPPRGWLSRYYGERVPVPSLRIERKAELPLVWITVIGAGAPTLRKEGAAYVVGDLAFHIRDGMISLA